jgi:hypothetical protein
VAKKNSEGIPAFANINSCSFVKFVAKKSVAACRRQVHKKKLPHFCGSLLF